MQKFLWMGVSVAVPLGNLGRGSVYRELREIVGGGLRKWSISLYESSVRETWRCKRRLWIWAPLSMGASLGNLGEGSYAGDLCVEQGLGRVSLHIGAPLGDLGRGGPYTENFEKWMKGSLGMGCVSLNRRTADGLKGGLLYWIP